jgi:hypothetical protein
MFKFSFASGGFKNAHDFVFTDHEQFFASDFDCLPGVFAEQHLVALFDFQQADFAIFHNLALAYGEYFTLVRFSAAVSGMTTPEASVRSSSRRLTRIRSLRGRIFISNRSFAVVWKIHLL